MDAPDVWFALGDQIHQDYLLLYPDFFSGIVEFYLSLSDVEKSTLVDYIDYLLAADFSNRELTNLWSSSGSSYILEDNDMKQFLLEIRMRLSSL